MGKTIFIMFGLATLCFIAAVTIAFLDDGGMKIVETKCYDRFSNEIQGLVCDNEVRINPNYGASLFLIGIVIVLIVFGPILDSVMGGS